MASQVLFCMCKSKNKKLYLFGTVKVLQHLDDWESGVIAGSTAR